MNSNAKLQLENWGASIDIFTPFLKQVHSSLGQIWQPLCSQLEGVCGRGEEWMLQTARDKVGSSASLLFVAIICVTVSRHLADLVPIDLQ